MPRPRRRSPRKPLLTVHEILAWVDDHHHRTGLWPNVRCGRIQGTNESWLGVDTSLHNGYRGLAAGSLLATFLSEHRGVRSTRNLPKLSERKIMRWAKAHFERHGKWPSAKSGGVDEVPRETRGTINFALAEGRRGLRGGSSQAMLLAAHGASNIDTTFQSSLFGRF